MFELHDPSRLEKEDILILPHRATDFDDSDVGLGCPSCLLDAPDDFLRDMWNHFDATPPVLQISFLLDDSLIHEPGRHIVVPRKFQSHEAFVIPHVLISLITIAKNEHLPVLGRIHRTGIDVNIRINLKCRHRISFRLQDETDRRSRDALPDTAHHPSDHEDELGRRFLFLRISCCHTVLFSKDKESSRVRKRLFGKLHF